MPIAQWLKTGKIKTSTPTTIGLPDPNERQNHFPCSTTKKEENAAITTISMMSNERNFQNLRIKKRCG